MNKKILTIGIIIFAFLLFLNLSSNVMAEKGCCLNPYVSACSANQIERSECCPADGIYGNQGPASQEECNLKFFVPGTDCADVDNCTPGCCCDPNPSIKPHVECLGEEGTVFWSPFNGERCDQHFCSQFSFVAPPNVEFSCSDGKPNVNIEAVRGKKEVKLIMSVEPDCTEAFDHFIIQRKEASGNFRTIADNVRSPVFIDRSVRWETTYTYRIYAYYDATHSFYTDASISTGNLACWHIESEEPFCLNRKYFNKTEFVMEFHEMGIAQPYDEWVDTNYAQFINNGVYCDAQNFLHISLDCGSDKTCVATEGGLKCYIESDCSLGSVENPFGLFGDVQACEGSDENKKYCFYDYSKSIANKCYKCNPDMECYDYKSKDACERDNCKANGLAGCEWVTYDEGLNIGVCKARGKDNCWAVASAGTGKVESYEAYNMIFNGPSQEKLNALSYPDFPCGTLDEYTCEDLVCEKILNRNECGSDPVLLDKDNNIVQGSNLCNGNVKVCTWLNGHCVKDADGKNGADCNEDDLTCQKDHFPPKTTIDAWARLTPKDKITFKIKDKTNAQDVYQEKALTDGYKLYLCAYPDFDDECGKDGYNNLNDFYEAPNLTLNVGDLLHNPKVGLKIGAMNTLKFFAVDKHHNVEPMNYKNIMVTSYLEDGIGIFMESPEPGWINSREVTLTYYVEADTDKIYYIELLNGLGGTIQTVLDDTSKADYSFEEQTPVHFNEGLNVIEIKVKTMGGKEKTKKIEFIVDTEKPSAPILHNLETQGYVEANHITVRGNLPGTKTDHPKIEIYTKLGDGNWIKAAETDVDEASGNFSKEIILDRQGDYSIKARAVDMAGNKGGFSNELHFIFVKSAPTFVVNPPNGAVRPFVNDIEVKFTLVSRSVGLDRTKTYIKLKKDGSDVAGEMEWVNSSYLKFVPHSPLDSGIYEVEVNSVDNSSAHHALHKTIQFTIDDVPMITANYDINEFKVNHNPLRIFGRIDGRGEIIANAYINVTTLPDGYYGLGSGEESFPYDVNIVLKEGVNLVMIKATNTKGKTAVEPFEITLDTTPPQAPEFRFG